MAEKKEKDKFYNNLSLLHRGLPQNDIRILLGDFNARIGNDTDAWPGVISKHSLHTSANGNGTRFLDFCALHEYVIGGSLFEHKDIHKQTWVSPKGDTFTQIDHICISKRWWRSLLDVRSFRGADINTTHYLLKGKLRLKLSSQRKPKKAPLPNLDELRSGEKVLEYQQCLHSKEVPRTAESSLEEDWNHTKSAFHTATSETLSKQSANKREQHLSTSTLALIEERNKLKKQKPSDVNKKEYEKLNKQVKKSVKNDDEKWAANISTKLQDAANTGNQREVWRHIKILSGKTQKHTSAVRDKNGNFITDPKGKLERWKEHFEELLNPTGNSSQVPIPDESENIYFPDLPMHPPTADEFHKALKKLKNHKAGGVDQISNEQLKYGGEATVEKLSPVFEKVWNQEKVPLDWPKGVIIKLGKKGDISVCSNNRGITLRAVTSKLFQIIIMTRLSDGIESLLRENQCGFRKDRSCADQLFSLRILIEHALEYNLPLVVNFIDFKAAFDLVNRDYIWAALKHYGMPLKYINIFKAFYENTSSAVRIGDELTDWFLVDSGTGQGDIQAPPLFNIVLNWVLERAMNEKTVSQGFMLQKRLSSRKPEKYLTDVDYADDIAAVDSSEAGLQETTTNIVTKGGEAGLKIGVPKTHTMCINKHHTQQPCPLDATVNIVVEGQLLQQVSHFTYLGSTITCDGSIDRELDIRIGKASSAFNSLNNIWRNSGVQLSTKVDIYRSAVVTQLLYGSASWTLKQQQLERLDAFHHRCLRRILKIKWVHHVTNREVRQRTRCCSIAIMISTNRLAYFGHVARMSEKRLPKYMLDWLPKHGHRSRGRRRTTLLDCLKRDLQWFSGIEGCDISMGKEWAQDRRKWKKFITDAKRRLQMCEQADPTEYEDLT